MQVTGGVTITGDRSGRYHGWTLGEGWDTSKMRPRSPLPGAPSALDRSVLCRLGVLDPASTDPLKIALGLETALDLGILNLFEALG